MGQQQLLLLVLGIIIVGIAIAVSIKVFRTNAIQTKREEMINESMGIAHHAMQYYRRNKFLGGGSYSFTGWSIPTQLAETEAGHFEVSIYADSVIITATGNEIVTDQDSVKVQTTVLPDSFYTRIIN